MTKTQSSLFCFCSISCFYLHIAGDPGQNTTDFGVNTWLVSFTTASSPAGDAHKVPTIASQTHQRSTTVTLKNSS